MAIHIAEFDRPIPVNLKNTNYYGCASVMCEPLFKNFPFPRRHLLNVGDDDFCFPNYGLEGTQIVTIDSGGRGEVIETYPEEEPAEPKLLDELHSFQPVFSVICLSKILYKGVAKYKPDYETEAFPNELP